MLPLLAYCIRSSLLFHPPFTNWCIGDAASRFYGTQTKNAVFYYFIRCLPGRYIRLLCSHYVYVVTAPALRTAGAFDYQ